MTKKINIILNENYKYIGKKGTISKVSLGYARNYLIPKNIAEFASEKKIKHYKMFQKIADKHNNQINIEANKIKSLLNTINKITTTKKIGENFQIFGNINEKTVIQTIHRQTSKILEKKQILMPGIKNIGTFKITILLTADIECSVNLNVIPENI